MKIAVIIPTYGRPEVAARLLAHLEGQSRRPDEVIVSAAAADHLPPPRLHRFPVARLVGPAGLAAQRNRAIEHAGRRSDVLAFFDDDFLPEDGYLARIEELFAEHEDWVVVMGRLVRDGAAGEGLDFDSGLLALRAAEANRPPPELSFDDNGAYGCNMSIRASAIGQLRFDERLVLYGWQEDVDFTSQLRPRGRLVRPGEPLGVHLGLKSGKVSGVRFGYSQIVNPFYLVRKGTISPRFALRLAGRNLAANLLRSVRPEPYVDRRGRLRGNLLALAHVVSGRLEPEYVLNI